MSPKDFLRNKVPAGKAPALFTTRPNQTWLKAWLRTAMKFREITQHSKGLSLTITQVLGPLKLSMIFISGTKEYPDGHISDGISTQRGMEKMAS